MSESHLITVYVPEDGHTNEYLMVITRNSCSGSLISRLLASGTVLSPGSGCLYILMQNFN